MFEGITSFDQNIGNWNVLNVTNMQYMFRGATNYDNGGNNSISGWTTSACTNMFGMFNGTKFNRNIGKWDVSNVTDMERMFFDATLFNQDIGVWDVSNVSNMALILSSTTSMNFSSSNYRELLVGWDGLVLQSGVTLDVQQCYLSGSSQTSRTQIITNYNWTINDLGQC
jgi:surface protein